VLRRFPFRTLNFVDVGTEGEGVGTMKWFWRGALIAVLGSFPLAMICALIYRFPIPFVGYRSGVNAVGPAFGAVLLYGLFGGFAVQGLLGGLASHFAARTNPNPSAGLVLFAALGAAAIGVGILAVLDRVVGPW